jgi:hypothetical protein
MTTQGNLAQAGLDRLAAEWSQQGLGTIEVLHLQTILGKEGSGGGDSPLPSSVAEVRVNRERAWVPAPCQAGDPEKGDAPVFLVGNKRHVLPTIRLCEGAAPPVYLSLSEWVLQAFTRWKFKVLRRGEQAATVMERVRDGRVRCEMFTDAQLAAAVAEVVRFCLLGGTGGKGYRQAVRRLALRLPKGQTWLREVVGETQLAGAVARRMVLTVQMKGALPHPVRFTYQTPREEDGLAQYHIRPCSDSDWGIDPVHTSEDEDARIVGYLGVGVGVQDRKLVLPEVPLHLSPSTLQIPFAQYDAPRRLLLAAKMQAQAIPLKAEEIPKVRVERGTLDPPGVNLRVAYMAWQGFNHEDAWVISKSAADKLEATTVHVQDVPIRAIEEQPRVLVQKDQVVCPGEQLLQRRLSPLLLAPESAGLNELASLLTKSNDWRTRLEERVRRLQRLDLKAEPLVKAKVGGAIEAIERWDLSTGDGVPQEVKVPDLVTSRYRMVVRFKIRRELACTVGDKLANRHGHKGIVGRVVPDEQMPIWCGEPLEALIDPISVLNRSNWGQIYETLLGAVMLKVKSTPEGGAAWTRERLLGASAWTDRIGRSLIQPPDQGDGWMSQECRAVAGVQFVMRLPDHVSDGLSIRPMRLSEQGTWACWAHGLGLTPATEQTGLSNASSKVRDTLWGAGIELERAPSSGGIRLRCLDLTQTPRKDGATTRYSVSQPGKGPKEIKKKLLSAMENLTPTGPAILVLKKKLPMRLYDPARRGGPSSRERESAQPVQLAYLPIPGAEVRPSSVGPDGREWQHQLTSKLKTVVQKAVDALSSDKTPWDLITAISKLVRAAYFEALGSDHNHYKKACLGKEILCRRLPRSGCAVISPAGWKRRQMELKLDEVGLPARLAEAVLGRRIERDAELLDVYPGERPSVWIKRDPVLHRWGLLKLKVRVVEGDTIRLPASLLGPLGADFDGDKAMAFAHVADGDERFQFFDTAADDVLNQATFYPGKQYVYGLHLLRKDRELFPPFRQRLTALHAPALAEEGRAKDALEAWARDAAGCQSNQSKGDWWAELERAALEALAGDPGMGLGLLEDPRWKELVVVECGAAKSEVFQNYGPESELYHAYKGTSLRVYQRAPGPPAQTLGPDLIATVMIPANRDKGPFGNVPRRLLYSANMVGKGGSLADKQERFVKLVRAVHAVSEEANQRVLSVKAGAGGLDFQVFKTHVLEKLLSKKDFDCISMPDALGDFLDSSEMKKACQLIRESLYQEVPGWLRWLRTPRRLWKILEKDPMIELPPDDPRALPFFLPGLASDGGASGAGAVPGQTE